MIIVKGRNKKSAYISNYIVESISKDSKVVIIDTYGSAVFPLSEKIEHFQVNTSFEDLAKEFDSKEFKDIVKNADIVVFYSNINESELTLLQGQEFAHKSIITVQSNTDLEIETVTN